MTIRIEDKSYVIVLQCDIVMERCNEYGKERKVGEE